MPDNASLIDNRDQLPDAMAVAVVMERRPSDHPWVDEVWTATGVTGDTQANGDHGGDVRIVDEQAGVMRVLHPGFRISLHTDECESYYHNLKSPEPGCYVIARNDEDDVPVPYLVSLSFDEANAYQECEDLVYQVAMPPEMYRWVEYFVLQHYVPEKRVKRKRNNWKNSGKQKADRPL